MRPVNILSLSFRVIIMIATLYMVRAFCSTVSAEEGFISAEYRYDYLDYAESEKEFVRMKGGLDVSENSGFYAATAWIRGGKEGSFTFAVAAAEPDSPFSIYAGDYYAQFGSGLLVGRGRPYNPDPFSKEKEPEKQSGFKPCTSGSPVSCF